MKSRSSQKGAAVVEFALLALLLLVFVFGIIEFGLLWVQSHYIANAAREGARVASKIRGTTADDIADRKEAAQDAAQGYLEEFFLYDDKVDDICFALADNCFLKILVAEKDLPGSPVTPAPRMVEVTVTTQSDEIWQPVLWPLLNLLPGISAPFGSDFLTSLTQSANFVIEED